MTPFGYHSTWLLHAQIFRGDKKTEVKTKDV